MTAAQMISFSRGAPSLDIVNVEGLKAAAARAFDADPAGITGYGTSFGYLPLRQWIADRHGVEVDRVLLTNGSLQADWFLFDALLQPGDAVVVEKPTYDRTLRSLVERGADVHQVTLASDGIDTTELSRLLDAGVRPKLAHIIPNFQNPAGMTLSLDKRRALLDLARAHNFVIFEDDPYAEIRFGSGEPLPSMLSLDASGDHVVFASSFTKTVCPGVRVGYLIGSRDFIAKLAKHIADVYISPGLVAQAIVHQFCVAGDFEKSVASVRAALSERVRVLGKALHEHLPEAVFTEPAGGYFLWVELPADVHVDALAPACKERGVDVVKGTDFLLTGGEHALRLAYSAVTVDQIDQGVRRLADAVAAVRTSRT